jgi:uncharacterized tellurite resistance protein B-like protein
MLDWHSPLRSERGLIGGRAAMAFLFAAWASTGFRYRRSAAGHSPFAVAEYSWLDALGVAIGVTVGIVAIVRWQRLGTMLADAKKTQDYRFFRRAGAPRTIHGLLLLVAARDGRVDAREREVVHRVLLRDLPGKVVPQDLKNWGAPQGDRDPIAMARHLAGILAPDDRQAVLRWCREVAAADGDDTAAESRLLHELEQVLGNKADPMASARERAAEPERR